jgi:hypothetical protein
MTLVIVAALPWAISLGVLGLWILLSEHETGALSSSRFSIAAGVSALAAAQLVFLMCIADRVFPKVPKRLARSVETGLGAILVSGTVVLSAVALSGGLS